MTAFFDKAHGQLTALLNEWRANPEIDFWGRVRDFELDIVATCQIAIELPGSSEDLRDMVANVVLARGLDSQPWLHDGSRRRVVDPKDEEDHCKALHGLIWDLHTVFHEAATADICLPSDNPRSYLNYFAGIGVDRVARLAGLPFDARASVEMEKTEGSNILDLIAAAGRPLHAIEQNLRIVNKQIADLEARRVRLQEARDTEGRNLSEEVQRIRDEFRRAHGEK